MGGAALSESYPLNDRDQIALTALCALSLPLNVILHSVRVNGIVDAQAAEKAALCCLLRDIIGNPFVPLTVERAWLTPKVVRLGRAIFEQRAFDRLPKLADALEDAGCWNFTNLGPLPGMWAACAGLLGCGPASGPTMTCGGTSNAGSTASLDGEAGPAHLPLAGLGPEDIGSEE